MIRHIVARVLMSAMLVITPAVSVAAVAAPVHAQPDDAADPPGQPALTLPWHDLGLNSEIYLSPDYTLDFTVPVPSGLTAVRLRGTINTENIDAGTLEIKSGGKVLAAIDLPPGALSRPATPLDVDISTANGGDSSVVLSFAVRPRSAPQNYTDRYCGPRQQLILTDLSTVFTGTEAPTTTIAGFFPPVLRGLTIYAPTDADIDEQQSVLTLVSTMARLYSDQPTTIAVVNQPRGATPPPAGYLTRNVVVERGGNASLKVENPGAPTAFLRVFGRSGELSTQLSLLVNKLQALAQVDTARVDEAGSPAADPSGDTLTFGQLYMTGKTDVIWISDISLTVGRASLGAGRIDGVRVHLLADYTPVAKSDSAAVVIRSGGVVVHRATLDDTGRLDATFDLDSQKLGQYIDLKMALTYAPSDACGAVIAPLTFEVDPRSTFSVHRGGPPLNGFSAAPSEFSPSLMVAMDGSGPDQLGIVARLVASIARSSSTSVTPQVVDVKTAADASTGALIVANSAALKQTSIHPPISGDGTAIDVDLPTALRANIRGGLGSIQAFADPPRNRSVILVTTTGAWTLVDPLFGYLGRLNDDLSKLSGDVLVAGAAGDPTNIAVRTAHSTTDVAESSAPPRSNRSISIGAGVAVAVGVIAAAAVWWRKCRATRLGPSNDEPANTPGPDV